MNGKAGTGLRFDPRTKLLLLFLCVLSVMFSPSLVYGLALVTGIALFGIVSKKTRYALVSLVIYLCIYGITILIVTSVTGTLRTMLVAFLGLVHKVYPCSMLAGIMISTTKVSEFLAAMNRIHVPKKIVIPLAVMIRYLPTIREDWSYIRDAMRMRDVSLSLKGFITNLEMTIECIYVPLMMAASKAADELSIAAVTRGIENPKPRTCLVQIRFGMGDILAVLCFSLFFLAEVLMPVY